MRPEVALLVVVLPVFCFLLHPAACHCVPRASPHAVPANHSSHFSSPTPGTSPPPPPPKSPPPYTYTAPRAAPPPKSPPPPTAPPPSRPAGLTLPFVGSVAPSLGPADGAVRAICSHTDHPDICASSVRSLLPVSGSLDAEAVLKLEMQALRTHLELAKSAAAEFLADAKNDQRLTNVLTDCISLYEDVPDSLDSTLKALETRDRGTVGSMLSALLTDITTCEDGFSEFDMESPMASYDETLTQLGSNCLAIAQAANLS